MFAKLQPNYNIIVNPIMWRKVKLSFITLLVSVSAMAQFKKQFFVEDSKEIKTVKVALSVNSGSCFVKPTKKPGILNVYGMESQQYNHSYKKYISSKGLCEINLDLNSKSSESLSRSISSNLFGDEDLEDENIWKIFFSEGKPYDLKLKYGMGQADMDLSGLAIQNCNIYSGSADVIVGYNDDGYNTISMDTFFVKVDMGTVKVRNLNQAKSKNILADVGFGNLLIDLSGTPFNGGNIIGNVGAGTLMVVLPKEEVPVKIKITDSWLCKVKLPREYKKVAENTYVNASFIEGSKELMNFEVDVSLGNLIFKQPDSNLKESR